MDRPWISQVNDIQQDRQNRLGLRFLFILYILIQIMHFFSRRSILCSKFLWDRSSFISLLDSSNWIRPDGIAHVRAPVLSGL